MCYFSSSLLLTRSPRRTHLSTSRYSSERIRPAFLAIDCAQALVAASLCTSRAYTPGRRWSSHSSPAKACVPELITCQGFGGVVVVALVVIVIIIVAAVDAAAVPVAGGVIVFLLVLQSFTEKNGTISAEHHYQHLFSTGRGGRLCCSRLRPSLPPSIPTSRL